MLDYGWKRLFSGLLAVTLVAGMLPPVTVAAEETEATEATEVVTVLETEPVETEPAITEPVTTEPEATEPVETTVATEAVTEPVETTVPTEETVPETTAETVAETTEATEPEETVAETTEETVAETTEETEATLPENVAAVQALIDAPAGCGFRDGGRLRCRAGCLRCLRSPDRRRKGSDPGCGEV